MKKGTVILAAFLLCPVLLFAQDLTFSGLCRQGDSLRVLRQYHEALLCYEKAESMADRQYASRRVNYYQHKADCQKNL